MTKQHFIALARRISQILNTDAREQAAEAVADVARQFNSAFDRARFLRACNEGH